MIEKVVRSTFSSNNVHGGVDGNNNPYRNMIIDAMRMNRYYADQCLIVDEEPNVNATSFFFLNLLQESNKPLWNKCTNHSKLSIIAQVFTIKLNHGLSEADYDIIIKWTISFLLEMNRLKENFYDAKSMIKPLGLGY
jgi:hypothetical protein